jgi:hypothetical protein
MFIVTLMFIVCHEMDASSYVIAPYEISAVLWYCVVRRPDGQSRRDVENTEVVSITDIEIRLITRDSSISNLSSKYMRRP